ncbi:uncharacterized protein JN550_001709 [Neoarthrinium moseri]|uniref:uncharacterized protein n=1 Tax=Neoarthrinium moseri TaxID=1658444 RepID=UPI001FDD7DBA|nr:uncharacterized protein JN550_001709 [Neoarthrinium moseri]KAI1876213.1 hypothetical protein JN550_001709 [Neoarthrinium moseri]
METLEALQARHRKEQRDLQGRITSKKKNATKKTRKGVNDECAELERRLKEQQEQELAALSGEPIGDDAASDGEINGSTQDQAAEATTPAVNGVAEQLENTSISNAETPPSHDQQQQAGKKRNRQKERMARRAAEQEAAAVAAEEEAKGMTDHRAIEKTYLLKEFKANGLVEKEIQPDGHCLFSAVADQLTQQGTALAPEAEAKGQLPYKVVRRRATDYMRGHRDDFAPFMEEDFDAYIAKIRDTAEWGGQLELMALANVYGVEIKVLQDGRTETIEPSSTPSDRGRIWLAYYRHGSFGDLWIRRIMAASVVRELVGYYGDFLRSTEAGHWGFY